MTLVRCKGRQQFFVEDAATVLARLSYAAEDPRDTKITIDGMVGVAIDYKLFPGKTQEFFAMAAVLDEAKKAVALGGARFKKGIWELKSATLRVQPTIVPNRDEDKTGVRHSTRMAHRVCRANACKATARLTDLVANRT